MIVERGRVIAVSLGLAEVECESRSACGSCSVNGACGTSLLERFFGRKQRIVSVSNPIGAQPGDTVVIGIAEGALLQAAFTAYLLPLLTMLVGAAVTVWLAGRFAPEWSAGSSVLGGLAGLAAGLWWCTGFSARRNGDARFQAVVLRRDATAPMEILFDAQASSRAAILLPRNSSGPASAKLP